MADEIKPNIIKVFVGPAESGKTRKAREIIVNKKYSWIDGRAGFDCIQKTFIRGCMISPETEYIFIDDVLSEKELVKFVKFFSKPLLPINNKNETMYFIHYPKIIITCSSDIENLTKITLENPAIARRIEVYQFPEEFKTDIIWIDDMTKFERIGEKSEIYNNIKSFVESKYDSLKNEWTVLLDLFYEYKKISGSLITVKRFKIELEEYLRENNHLFKYELKRVFTGNRSCVKDHIYIWFNENAKGFRSMEDLFNRLAGKEVKDE